MTPDVDVVVTDGFTGNVVLKTLEGGMRTLVSAIFGAFGTNDETQAASEVLIPALMPLYATLDPDNTGGAMLLGVDGLCLISHGSSSATAIVNAVRVAKELHDAEIVRQPARRRRAKLTLSAGVAAGRAHGDRHAHRGHEERPPEGVRVVRLAEPRQADAADHVAEREHVRQRRHDAGHHLAGRAAAAEEEHRHVDEVAERRGRPSRGDERSDGAADRDEADHPREVPPGHAEGIDR